MKRLSRWRLLVVISILVGAFAVFPYLGLDPAKSRIKLDPALELQFPLLLVHIFTAFLALLIGPLQFWKSFRLKYVRFHRLIGIVYLGCLGISATTGVVITAYEESFTKQLAFLTLTMLWLVTGWKGFAAIRRRDVRARHFFILYRSNAYLDKMFYIKLKWFYIKLHQEVVPMSTYCCKHCGRPVFKSSAILDRRVIWDLTDYQAECYLISEALQMESLHRYDTSLHEGWYCCRFIMMRMTTDKFGTGSHLLVYTDAVQEVPDGEELAIEEANRRVIRLTHRDFDDVVGNPTLDLIVVKFGAIWCPPCRLMDTVFDRLPSEGDFSRVKLFEVDIDEEQELSSRWNFLSIPFTLVFKGDRQIDLAHLGYPSVDGGLIGGITESAFRELCMTALHS